MGLLTPDGTLLEVNDSALAFVGASRDDVIGRPFWDTPWWRGSEDSRRRLRAAVVEAATGQRVRFEAEHLDKDGVVAHIDFSLSPARDDAGRVQYLVPEGRDVTDLKRAEAALRASETRFAVVANLAPVGLSRADLSGRLTFVNDAICDMTGLTPEQVKAGDWVARVHPDDRAAVLTLRQQAPNTGMVGGMEFRLLRPDGQEVWVLGRMAPERDESGAVVGRIGTMVDITNEKRAAAERLAGLVRVRGLMAAAAGVWEWDAQTNAGVWDERTRAIHGFPPAATPTFERWAASVHEDDRARVFARLDALRHTPGDDRFDMEFRVTHVDGTVRWTHTIAHADRDRDGRLTGMTGVVLDITDRKKAVDRAQALEGRLHEFATTTSDILYSMRMDGGVLSVLDFMGPAAERVYGRPSAAFLANPNLPMEVVHPDDQPRVFQALEALSTTGQFDETYRITRPGGTIRWLHDRAHAVRTETDGVLQIDGIARDVTELKAAEAKLRAAETLSQSIIESAVDGIIVIDDRGTIERVNPSGRRLFGYTDEELVGQNVQVLMPAPYREQHDEYLSHYRATGEKRIIGIGREVEGRRKDGSTFPLFLSVSEMWLPAGRRFAGIVHDLTALNASQAEVERSHAALEARATELERQTHQLRRLAAEATLAEQQAREQLAKTLHDGLQQLLFSATMKLDRAVERGVADALVERARGEVQDAIAAARSLSVELHPPALHAGDLPGALTWLADWVRERYRLTVRVSAEPAADPADDDVRILLFESVRELIFNTVKHAQVRHAAIELGVRDGRLVITVSDEGVGFDPATALGAERDYHGGLGLFGIRERLTLLGGHLRVDSAPGRGTRFTLDVPFSRGTREAHERSSAPESIDRREAVGRATPENRPLRILLVDDHALVREGLRELLTQHADFEVVGEAADGHEAVRQARALHPDVVLMDVSMPGMDGVEATRRLRAELPHVQVFGLSTQEVTGGRHAIEDAGAVGYFAKATSTHLLLERLRAEHAAAQAERTT